MSCEVYRPPCFTDHQMEPHGPNRTFGARLQMAREVRGMSPAEAAGRLGIRVDRLRQLELGTFNVSKPMLDRLSLLYNFPLTWFRHEVPWDEQYRLPIIFCGQPGAECLFCEAEATLLCDYPLGEGKTCDIALCPGCAVIQGRVGNNETIDYCPQHALMANGQR